ncbi:hypothetical protein BCR39DRAFT_596150 [Naematelia encephala]|uniref:Uncharacterized protein n=1 Tax=Naematelia encephala TaxID=71784 RepID=A0A1Y2BLF9_9TREE|nr:hypothetical protein BCR39DRAFT_596150 [Naematelia encephala]
MFATVARGRQNSRRQVQELDEIEVPAGSDSCFGVRSLNGSVEWEVAGGGMEQSQDPQPDSKEEDDDKVDDNEEEQNGEEEEGEEDRMDSPKIQGESTISEDTPIAPPWCPLPLSPETTLYLLSPNATTLSTPNEQERDHPDNLSEPSSPASFTSMPTVSSMSRTSSPIGDADFRGPEGLVLPTLSLPSTSLHMSLRRWDGEARGIKVVLLGSTGVVRRSLRELGERLELVELASRGEVGIVRDGKVQIILVTGLGETRVDGKISDAYSALHALLHPSPPRGTNDKIKAVIQAWARREEWVHLIYAIDAESSLVKSLAPIVPVLCPRPMDIDAPLFTLPSQVYSPHMADPTPMPHQASHEYFSTRSEIETSQHVETLLNILESTNSIEIASIAKFLNWRPPSLDSSVSTSAASSSFEPPLMPTVARVHGGGEWEATLSRRIAKRRDVVERPARGKPRRRRTSRSQERAPSPLFPKGSSSPAGQVRMVGLIGTALEKARGLMFGKWKWVGVAAVAVALGWGLWASKSKF